MKPHKHAEVIKAWADGAEIQIYCEDAGEWEDTITDRIGFQWYENMKYRVKPEPKPDVVEYYYSEHDIFSKIAQAPANLKLIFDGETGKLKSAEVLK